MPRRRACSPSSARSIAPRTTPTSRATRSPTQAWQYHDDVVQALLDDRSLPQRAQMRLDPRPLFRRDAWGRAQAGTASGDEAEDDRMTTHHDIDRGPIDDGDFDAGPGYE